MNYEYRTHGEFPCKRMDLEAMGSYPDIVLKISNKSKISYGNTWIEISIFTDEITETEALKQIAKALNISSNKLILF